jgi:7,8-dihydropterin-6-yl-methyl-4-(beta-D-ribofuranosyl)aminobenzene 5'-phosphate synthase
MDRKTFIYSFLLGSGGILIHAKNMNAMQISKGEILIRMIYNNTGKTEGLENAWGLSAWIDDAGDITLFDTGGDPEVLDHNLVALGLDAARINRIIISHDHWDHNGGIGMILEKCTAPTDLYIVEKHREKYTATFPRARVTGIDQPEKITPHIWSTGSQSTSYRQERLHEQSVIITNETSMLLLTGCSHPGIVNIAKRAMEIHPEKQLELVTGGFHLMRTPKKEVEEISGQLMDLGISKIAPSHCTGDRSIDLFREKWGDRFIDMNLGDTSAF